MIVTCGAAICVEVVGHWEPRTLNWPFDLTGCAVCAGVCGYVPVWGLALR